MEVLGHILVSGQPAIGLKISELSKYNFQYRYAKYWTLHDIIAKKYIMMDQDQTHTYNCQANPLAPTRSLYDYHRLT